MEEAMRRNVDDENTIIPYYPQIIICSHPPPTNRD